jgi:branched-chain amino acid transport system substrate-binding protein
MRGVCLVRRRAISLWAIGAVALAVAGCGTQTSSSVSVTGTKLTIYTSQPPGTASQTTTDVLDAERLAYDQAPSHQAGKLRIDLAPPLHGAEISDNGRTAIQDKTAIAYLGELVPGTSGVSVQINNQQGLLEVSPVDTAVYLTQPSAAVSGSPGHFYPSSSTFHQTFARVVPTTAQEAKALVGEMNSLRLTKLALSSDGSPYGDSIVSEVRSDAPTAGLSVVSGAAGADAVFYAGAPGAAATKALDQAAATNPSAKLFAPSALYDDSFVAGLSPAAQRNLYVSSPGFAPTALSAAGRRFVAAFTAKYGHAPAPQAIFGYEAMTEVLYVLGQEGANADSRADMVSSFRTLKDPPKSVLGTYSIVGGDTNIAPFIFGRPVGGKLVARPPA